MNRIIFMACFVFFTGPTKAESLLWDPGFTDPCAIQYEDDVRLYTGHCNEASQKRWRLTSTHETEGFSGGTLNDLWINVHPSATMNFAPQNNGVTHEIQLALDTLNVSEQDNYGHSLAEGHTTLFVSTRAGSDEPFTLEEHLVLEVDVQLRAIDLASGAATRIVLGSAARWDDAIHFVEVSLFQTDGYDRCTPTEWITENDFLPLFYGPRCEGPCDTGKFDRRYIWPPTKTEVAVYTGAGVITPTLELNQYQRIQVPIAALYRDYPWAYSPKNGWSSVTELNLYIGIESNKSALTWVHFKKIDLRRL